MTDKFSFPFVAVCTLFILLTGSTSFAAEVSDHIYSGNKFVQEKKYKEAAREFETAVRLDPENSQTNLLAGLALANTGELDKAEQYSLKAVQLEPSYAGYYNLGLIYSNQAVYDKAANAYEQAVKLNPKSYQTWHQLGKVYATTLSFDKAIKAYQKAVELNPKFPDAYQGLGSAYYWSGNLTSALQQVDELGKFKFEGKAQELERWIKNKESKKKKSTKKTAKE
jgi:tetratricopeptide (TPR) repeat protein